MVTACVASRRSIRRERADNMIRIICYMSLARSGALKCDNRLS